MTRLFGRDSIGAWVLLRMALLLVLLGGLFLSISLLVLYERFNAFDEEQYRQDLSRVALVIEKDRDAFSAFLVDYANFNDSYSFIQAHHQDYIESNFTSQSMTTLGINYAIILDLSGEIIIGLNRTLENPLIPINEQLQTQLLSGIDLSALKNSRSANIDVLWINGKPLLRGIAAINNSSRNATPNGFMVFAKELNQPFLDQIRELTAVNFSLIPASTNQEQEGYAERSNSFWRLSKTLASINADIIVEGETKLKSQRRISAMLLVLNAIALVVLTLFGIYGILSRRILRRITEFSLLADQRRTHKDKHIRWQVKGGDELDNLALSLNEMLDEIQTRHDELEYLSNHDSLTTIGNRRLLRARLAELQQQDSEIPLGCLLSFDIDGFNLVNDGLGHHAGDQTLRIIAERVLSLIQTHDTAVRLGGDEFAILIATGNLAASLELAEKLQASLAEPIVIDNKNLVVSISIGITTLDQALTVNEIIRNADLAMQEAKRLGKGRYCVFNNNLFKLVSRRNHLEQALRHALSNNELEVWFQPIIMPETNTVVSMEALARWHHEGEFIHPDEFISIAEKSGLVCQLGNIILNRACAALATLRKSHPDLSCSVNVSALQFTDSNILDDIHLVLRTNNLPASALHLELTESAVALHEVNIAPLMYALVGQGVHFHLDDFGTGYSSLDRLQNLPFDTLKIDRSFVTPLRIGDDIMARNIIRMGKDLGMNVIGEGIETEEELKRLLQLGCKQIQGFLFAAPMPLAILTEWLSKHKSEHS
jgi:diguanylate cyclase (GGDEF)-like protein